MLEKLYLLYEDDSITVPAPEEVATKVMAGCNHNIYPILVIMLDESTQPSKMFNGLFNSPYFCACCKKAKVKTAHHRRWLMGSLSILREMSKNQQKEN